MTQVELILGYLNHPIRMEGTIQKMTSGEYALSDEVLKEGTVVEFFYQGHWKVGRLIKDMEKQDYIINDIKTTKIMCEHLAGLKARIR